MGDYTNSGQKIGTCGNAYYSTKKMLKDLYASGERHGDVAGYLNTENYITFAFPFPEYDGKKIGEISNFHEGERIDYFFDFLNPKESVHKEITTHIHPKGGQGINLFTPCPHSDNSKVSNNFKKEVVTFRLVGQINERDGNLKIVAECIYCNTKNVFSKKEANQIIKVIKEKAERAQKSATYTHHYHESEINRFKKEAEYNLEIAKRIKETYKK
jgi:uncharacterized protein involved in tolerance to divalent cations